MSFKNKSIENILNTTNYEKLYEVFNSEELVKEAGYFLAPNVDEQSTVNLLCTPFNFLKKPFTDKHCILISSGSYCPIHEGHLEIMQNAKKYLESKKGYEVLGGYFSPGHDEYIESKNKTNIYPIHIRIKLINDLIKDIDWLEVDPWAPLFNTQDINFTTVIKRLELYIKQHRKDLIDTEIIYVCGGDNSNFSLSFLLEGNCVVVNRPGNDIKFNHYKNIFVALKADNRIHFIHGDNMLSSTIVRSDINKEQIKSHNNKKNLKLRFGETHWESLFLKPMLEIFEVYYNKIEIIKVSDQEQELDNILNEKQEIINLDSIIQRGNKLQVSRLYDFFGNRKLGYVNRIKSDDFETQLKEIDRTKNYVLFDDDIATGGTIKFANKILKEHNISISSILTLNLLNDNNTEILDLRDFIFGIDNGGLTIQYNEERVRLPYIYPYVCPFIRYSINEPMEFSKKVWDLNLGIFLNYSPHISFSHNSFLVNLTGKEKFVDICAWHLSKLKVYNF